MPSLSDEFELLQSRVFKLINSGAKSVEWNVHLADPDTDSQRQIDVLILEGDGRRIAVECRRRESVQDVMWIEELHGRKLSLGFDQVIAVSKSGFTKPAVKKAARFGIPLYDLVDLTDAEIESWLGRATIKLFYLTFPRLDLVAIVPLSVASAIAQRPDFRKGKHDGFHAVMARLRKVLDDTQLGGKFRTRLPTDGFTVDEHPLRYLVTQFEATREVVEAKCIMASLQSHPDTDPQQRETKVQRFDQGVPELIEFQGKAHILYGTEGIKSPPNSILDRIQIVLPTATEIAHSEWVGARRIEAPADALTLVVTASDEVLSDDDIWDAVRDTSQIK